MVLLLLHPSFFLGTRSGCLSDFELRRSYGAEKVPSPTNQPTPITRHYPLRFPIDIYGQDVVLKISKFIYFTIHKT